MTMEDTVEKLLKDCKKFNEAVISACSSTAINHTALTEVLLQIFSLRVKVSLRTSVKYSTPSLENTILLANVLRRQTPLGM